jgi:hypothetical protein
LSCDLLGLLGRLFAFAWWLTILLLLTSWRGLQYSSLKMGSHQTKGVQRH